ncbi:MAG: hypothetical protein B9S32_09180 [Verrucomicrobia bacterium Tous-C9LFEB]|nr:MAG: hypothetical protein B9S32_09180 [Verrucomicrobia bacterium Tous-C9LFEB]
MKQVVWAVCLLSLISTKYVFGEEKAFDPSAAFRSLSDHPVAVLTIPPGRYRLPNEGLILRGVKNTTIEARGVTFIATNKDAPVLQIFQSENVKLVGATFDYDPLPFTQGSITAYDAKEGVAEFEIHAGYADVTKEYVKRRLVHLFEKDAPRWKPGSPDYYAIKIDILTPRTGRIFFAKTGRDMIKVGDRVVFNIRQIAGITMKQGCKGIAFEDVTVYAAPALGFLVRFCEDSGVYKNVRVIPGPKPEGATQERLFSTCADAFNAAYTRKGPVMDGCEFSYMGDDSVNLHGVTLPVLKWIDDRTFLSMRPQRGDAFESLIRPGDEIRFLKEPNYQITATARVESAAAAEENRDTWLATAKKIWPTFRQSDTAAFYRIRLVEPVSGVAAGDFCDIPATSAPNFVIRNSSFHDHRGRGLRLMSNDGVVENNRFERIKGSAITVGPEFAYWREAGWCRNIAVRNNRITDVGEGINITLPESYSPGAIAVIAHVMPQGPGTLYYPGNENISISGNTIDGCSVSGISVVAAKDVKITDNILRRVNLSSTAKTAMEYGLTSSSSISIIQAQAEVTNNKVEAGAAASKISVNP